MKKTMNNPISRIRITTVDPMKWAALLNILPLSFGSKMGRSLKTQALMPTWTTRKLIRNKPESAITSFLPTEEVKNSDHFISKILRNYLSNLLLWSFRGAKVARDRQNPAKI